MAMKKLFALIGAAAFTCVFSVPEVQALVLNTGLSDAAETGAGYSNIPLATSVGSLIGIFLSFLGVIFLILTVYAGFMWMTAMGEEKKIAKAKNILIGAVVGLVIIMAAYAITDYITKALIVVSG